MAVKVNAMASAAMACDASAVHRLGSMDLSDKHVVVVGAAAGGAAAALACARGGARVTVVERIASPRAVGAGIAIAANGLAVLRRLGVEEAVVASAEKVGAPRVVDGRDRVLLRPPPSASDVRVLRRSELQGILLDALAAHERIEVKLGLTVHEASRDGLLRVAPTPTTRGNPAEVGEGETLRADLVIGADGVHSRVRACGDFGARVRKPGIPYLRVLVPGDHATETEAWTNEGLFGSLRVRGGTYAYASAGSPAMQRALAARDLDAIRRLWSKAYARAGAVFAAVDAFEDVLVNAIVRVDCERWHDGRLVVLGDAAHAMAPNLGQGANSALVDAVTLVDELQAATDFEMGLRSWTARRRPKVKWVADTADALGAMAELRGPVARFVRDRLLMPMLALQGRIGRDPTPRVLQEPLEVLG